MRMKRLKRGKNQGIVGIFPDVIKESDGEFVKQSCMLAKHCGFPELLCAGLVTTLYESGNKSEMSNCLGITVGFVIAKLFELILGDRTASWPDYDNHAVKDSLEDTNADPRYHLEYD